jgi:hypothetical protein
VKVTIILDFVDEVGLDYQANKLRHTINVEISPACWQEMGTRFRNFSRQFL